MRTAATVKNTFKSERADAMRQLGDLLKAENERAVVNLLVNDLLDSFVRTPPDNRNSAQNRGDNDH